MHRRKYGYYTEKFKTLLLATLVVTCIIQVGILWSSQSGSFPFSFLGSVFSSNPMSQATSDDIKGDFVRPYKVILSSGYESDHFIIENGSEDYKLLWENAHKYLAMVLGDKPKQVMDYNPDDWGRLVASRPYAFEFKTSIPIELIEWAIETKCSSEGPRDIYKFIISPNDTDNNYSDMIYIRSSNKIFVYEMPKGTTNSIGAETFLRLYNSYTNRPNAKNYEFAFEKFRTKQGAISQDILTPITKISYELYPDTEISPLFESSIQNGSYDLDSISEKLFGDSVNDLFPDYDGNGALVFKNGENIYRIYKDSTIEYRYIGFQVAADKPNLLDAYKKAITFLIEHSKHNKLLSGVNVYLKSVEEKTQSYVFQFDITIDTKDGQVPVLVNNYDVAGNKLSSVISIEVNSKRVVHGQWIATTFKPSEYSKEYQLNISEVADNLAVNYPTLDTAKISIRDVEACYVLKYTGKTISVSPRVAIFTDDNLYDIPLKQTEKK